MSLTGLIVGISVFAVTGLLHPVVIKSEYRWGKGCWPIFLVLGLLCCAGSLVRFQSGGFDPAGSIRVFVFLDDSRIV